MWLFTFTSISFVYILHGINVCRNECNDGGCAYKDKQGVFKGCDCRVSSGSQTGDTCESFANACETYNEPPCQNNGKCVPSNDFLYCDCPAGYFGSQCEYKS